MGLESSQDDLRRYELQSRLEEILGSKRVYFQAPQNKQIQYPAIIYQLDNVDTRYADDIPYARKKRYQVTWIGKNPDSDVPDKIGELPMSRFSRFYVANNLNHHVYQVYW